MVNTAYQSSNTQNVFATDAHQQLKTYNMKRFVLNLQCVEYMNYLCLSEYFICVLIA